MQSDSIHNYLVCCIAFQADAESVALEFLAVLIIECKSVRCKAILQLACQRREPLWMMRGRE